MLNNNFTTEAIVAKYVTAVKNLLDKSVLSKPDYQPAMNEIEFYSAQQQLIAQLWYDHKGCPANHPFLVEGKMDLYRQFYKDNLITEEEYAFLLANYSEVIETIMSDHKHWLFQEAVDFEDHQTKYLGEFVEGLLCGGVVFLPFCGYGDIAVQFKGSKVIGYVGSDVVAALVQIRLDAAGIESLIKVYRPLDGMAECLPEEKVDSIFCDMTEDSLFAYCYPDYTLEKFYDTLADNGRMIAFCSSNVLTTQAGRDAEFRERLYEEKTLAAITQLPEGLFNDSETSPVILIIDKDNSSEAEDGILMLDASNSSSEQGGKATTNDIDVDTIVSCIKESKNQEKGQTPNIRVSYDDIDSQLMIPAYYLRNGKFVSNRCLTDLVDIVPPITNGLVITGKYENDLATDSYVRSYCYDAKKGLTSNFAKARFNGERIDQSWNNVPDIEHYNYYTVKPCIFLALTGSSVSVCYTDKYDVDAFYALPYTMICLKPKEGISPEYVAALLLSKEIKEQMLIFSAGSVIRRINQNLLSKVLIPEHSTVQMTQFLLNVMRESLRQREEELVAERENYGRNVRLRKHALSQSISSFGAMFNTLNLYRVKHNGELKDEDVVSQITGKTVGEIFDVLNTRVKSIQEKLAHIADIDIDFGQPESIDPEDFILQYIKSKKSTWLNFVGETSWNPRFALNKNNEELRDPENNTVILKVGDTLNSFSFPKAALEHVFNNIVANAIAHGFTDESRSDYKVRFSWEIQGLDIVIIIENNGNPLPDGVNSKDILAYGYSTKLNVDGHNGIGGSEIASIMQGYQGDVEVVSNAGAELPVKYLLRFHNTNMVGSF